MSTTDLLIENAVDLGVTTGPFRKTATRAIMVPVVPGIVSPTLAGTLTVEFRVMRDGNARDGYEYDVLETVKRRGFGLPPVRKDARYPFDWAFYTFEDAAHAAAGGAHGVNLRHYL